MIGTRRQARESALQILFGIDLSGNSCSDGLENYFMENPLPPEAKEFTVQLVRGTLQDKEKIDGYLEKYSLHWKLYRMEAIDRNLLRMAAYELLNYPEIPSTVTLNEAIEIAKKYGTIDSSSFINGILDRLVKELKSDLPEPHKQTSR